MRAVMPLCIYVAVLMELSAKFDVLFFFVRGVKVKQLYLTEWKLPIAGRW